MAKPLEIQPKGPVYQPRILTGLRQGIIEIINLANEWETYMPFPNIPNRIREHEMEHFIFDPKHKGTIRIVKNDDGSVTPIYNPSGKMTRERFQKMMAVSEPSPGDIELIWQLLGPNPTQEDILARKKYFI